MALPNPLAFRVSGGETSIEDMIATTERGILVTRFSEASLEDAGSVRTLSVSGVTRDGLWLIEHGQLTSPIKNMWFYESAMSVFNRVLQIGQPVGTNGFFHTAGQGEESLRDRTVLALNDGRSCAVVPPMKVQDFNFTRVTSAV